jgi:hypothetical protein
MKPRSSFGKFNAASGERTMIVTLIIATSCLVFWFVFSALYGYTSLGWLATYLNWIALRGIKEWLFAWLCLWGATLLPKSNWSANGTIFFCAFSLVLLEQGSLYLNAAATGLFSLDFLMFFTPLILLELCNLYWMYAGVLIAIRMSQKLLIATNSYATNSVPTPSIDIKKKARRAVLKGLLFTTIFSTLIIMIWVAASWGRLPNTAGLLLFFQSVVVTPLFRLICGLSVAGLFFLIPSTMRRPKTGILILGVVSLVVVVYSRFFASWGSHFSLLGSIFPGFQSVSSLLALPVIVALSPVGGFALGIPLLWLHGYRFVELPSSSSRVDDPHAVGEIQYDSEDTNDPEMYL